MLLSREGRLVEEAKVYIARVVKAASALMDVLDESGRMSKKQHNEGERDWEERSLSKRTACRARAIT